MIYVLAHLPSAKQTKRNGSDVFACDVSALEYYELVSALVGRVLGGPSVLY